MQYVSTFMNRQVFLYSYIQVGVLYIYISELFESARSLFGLAEASRALSVAASRKAHKDQRGEKKNSKRARENVRVGFVSLDV